MSPKFKKETFLKQKTSSSYLKFEIDTEKVPGHLKPFKVFNLKMLYFQNNKDSARVFEAIKSTEILKIEKNTNFGFSKTGSARPHQYAYDFDSCH